MFQRMMDSLVQCLEEFIGIHVSEVGKKIWLSLEQFLFQLQWLLC